MPKETVYDASNLFDLEVGWAHDRDVQLGITTHDGRSLAEWLAGLPEAEAGAPLPQFSSLWASLDRGGINRLIKMLRKARDDAYGRDE